MGHGVVPHLTRILVRTAGLEPARSYEQEILSLWCLPFHHVRSGAWGRIRTCDLSVMSGQLSPLSYPGKKEGHLRAISLCTSATASSSWSRAKTSSISSLGSS